MLHCPRKLTRTIMYYGLCCGAVLTTTAGTAFAADPTGDWMVADQVANIRVAECNGSMWGVVAWEKTPGCRDVNNPDVSLQSRPSLGMPILIDMKKKTGADQWEGQVYNAKDGKLYSSTIKPVGSDKLEIQGCVLGFLCGGETWTRVAPPIPSSPSNSMAKGPPKPTSGIKTTGLPGQPAQPKTVAPPPPPAPKTTGSTAPKPVVPGQKTAAAASGDVVGDICILPDIARFAH
jgi:uncharacterized protein (DUF2147 family)